MGVGAGLRLDASGTFPRAAVDLVRGDPDGAHVVGHLGLASGILRDGTVRLGTDPASDWLAGPRDTVTFDCRGTAVLLVDGMPRANAPLGRPCLPEPLWIVAPNALTITEVRVDGRPVPLVGRPFDPRRGALTGGAAALVLLGVAGARRRRVPADTEAPAGLPQGGGG